MDKKYNKFWFVLFAVVLICIELYQLFYSMVCTKYYHESIIVIYSGDGVIVELVDAVRCREMMSRCRIKSRWKFGFPGIGHNVDTIA